MPDPAQPRHTNHWAPRTRKRHQREHRPQRPTEGLRLLLRVFHRRPCPVSSTSMCMRNDVPNGLGGHVNDVMLHVQRTHRSTPCRVACARTAGQVAARIGLAQGPLHGRQPIPCSCSEAHLLDLLLRHDPHLHPPPPRARAPPLSEQQYVFMPATASPCRTIVEWDSSDP